MAQSSSSSSRGVIRSTTLVLCSILGLGQAFSPMAFSGVRRIRRASSSLLFDSWHVRQPQLREILASSRQGQFLRPFSSRGGRPFGGHGGLRSSSAAETAEPEPSLENNKTPSNNNSTTTTASTTPISLYRSEGILAVEKPLNWTSQDVVSCCRGALERDARRRGCKPARVGSRRQRNKIVRVGHGGTLDPLATGVLVIGVGKGTKELEGYLKGSKRYLAGVELGYETTTLDSEGNITKTAPTDHVTWEAIQAAIPQFVGDIKQIPPIFSAIRKDGKKMYEHARKGTGDDIKLEPRDVTIYDYQLVEDEESNADNPISFKIDVECGGGTYIRSLVRDLGYALDTVATTTYLRRTKQGQFTEEDCLPRDDWNPDSIYAAIDRNNEQREVEGYSP